MTTTGPNDPGETGTSKDDGERTGAAQSSSEESGAALEEQRAAGGESPETGVRPASAADAPIAATRTRSGMFGVRGTGDTSGFGGLRLPGYAPAPAERPFGGWFDEVADELGAALDQRGIDRDAIRQITIDRGEITFYVQRDRLADVARTFRDDPGLRYEFCSSVSGVDYSAPDGEPVESPLHVVYHLLSMTYRRRIRLEVVLDFDDPHVPSVVDVYPTADWHERETWDMFGVIFDGHPALTRILMPDDWEGFPQRKSYPLGGIPVEYKGAEIPPPDERRAYS